MVHSGCHFGVILDSAGQCRGAISKLPTYMARASDGDYLSAGSCSCYHIYYRWRADPGVMSGDSGRTGLAGRVRLQRRGWFLWGTPKKRFLAEEVANVAGK